VLPFVLLLAGTNTLGDPTVDRCRSYTVVVTGTWYGVIILVVIGSNVDEVDHMREADYRWEQRKQQDSELPVIGE
jgi:hypothetical protein